MEILRERPSARYLERGGGAGSPAPHPDHVHPGIMAWMIASNDGRSDYEIQYLVYLDAAKHIDGCVDCNKIFDAVKELRPMVTRKMFLSGLLFTLYPPRL